MTSTGTSIIPLKSLPSFDESRGWMSAFCYGTALEGQ